MKVLVTGASGCVGHATVRALLRRGTSPELIVRDPARLDAVLARQCPLVVSDLRGDAALTAARSADVLVHLATSWTDGPEAHDVNVEGALALVCAAPARVVFVSTASALSPDGSPSRAALEYGTPYVRSKAEALRRVNALSRAVTCVCPTLVAGPGSHLTRELLRLRWALPLARFVTSDLKFHFIHAHDLGELLAHLALDEGQPPRVPFVAGQPAIPVGEALKALVDLSGRRPRPLLRLTPHLLRKCGLLPGVRLSAWDRHELARGTFEYRDPLRPETFGWPSRFPTFTEVAAELRELARQGQPSARSGALP